MDDARPDPDRAKRTLWAGILVYRWASLLWMTVMALAAGEPFARPEVVWASVGAAAAWTLWLTLSGSQTPALARWFDLALAVVLVIVSGLAVGQGEIDERPFFAAAYPITAALVWGAARGPIGGLAAGLALGAAYVLARPVNGIGLAELGTDIPRVANGAVNYLLAGGAVGVVARLLDRSSLELRAATEAAIEARERAARLAERESIARTIHDSVLQALAMINKRARELSSGGPVAPHDVQRLAALAAEQERELRALILREPAEAPGGMVSLRASLEDLGREYDEPPVTVTAVGPIWLQASAAQELTAAVRQALDNVVRHAGASKATVYAEVEGHEVVVTVRDDGRGFEYDEDRLRSDGKLGILKSIKGRVEELGGLLSVHAEAGRGTEIELRIPSSER